MEAPGKWQASPLPSRSGKHHEEMTSSSVLGSCGPVCEVRYDKLPLMSCFPEVDPSPKWTQITPAGRQRPSSRNWENWAGTSVEWEGFPDSEASRWPTQDLLVLSGRTCGKPSPSSTHSALEGRVGYELRGFTNRFQDSCPLGKRPYRGHGGHYRCQWECLAFCLCFQHGA